MDEAQEQPPSNAPLVELHAKLVTVLWIVIGLEMKSVKPLSLFDTTVIIRFVEHLSFRFYVDSLTSCERKLFPVKVQQRSTKIRIFLVPQRYFHL